jgi:dihydroneopterin aldolase
MSDRIALTGISATGFHGVFPEERRDGQIFIVDL